MKDPSCQGRAWSCSACGRADAEAPSSAPPPQQQESQRALRKRSIAWAERYREREERDHPYVAKRKAADAALDVSKKAAESPTPISTDNLANHKVGSGIGGPTRSKHFLRRYHSLKQRIRDGDAVLVHVPDPQMPADFLTKWIPSAKLEASLRYACNSHRPGSAAADSATCVHAGWSNPGPHVCSSEMHAS